MTSHIQVRRFAAMTAVFLTIGSLWGTTGGGVFSVQAAAEHNSVQTSVDVRYGQLPLSFIANAGQIDPSVRFQVRSSAGTLSFESDGVTLNLPVAASNASQAV